jgi:penicillin-binding protein 1A
MKTFLKKLYYIFYLPLKSVYGALFYILSFGLFVVLFISMLSFEILFENEIFLANPDDINSVVNWKPSHNTRVYDKAGRLISEQFSQYHLYTPYSEIPENIKRSILAIEDRHFFKHKGIDVVGIVRAGLSYLNSSMTITQGASTITQQVVKNLLLSPKRTFKRKIREIVLSLYLEKSLGKEKIFEIYCNSLFLGEGAYGIAAAAKRFFNKELDEIEDHEAALIAGMFQSPAAYNPFKNPAAAKKRQEQVLVALKEMRVIDRKDYQNLSQRELKYHQYQSLYGKKSPYFVDYVIKEAKQILDEKGVEIKDSGIKIYTTLDSKIDGFSKDAIKKSQKLFEQMEKSSWAKKAQESEVEAAILVIDRKTGDILSMQGGRDYAQTQFNRAADALRAPGSVFKPVIYSLALEQGYLWNKLYYVAPVTVGNYRPHTQSSKLLTETTMLHSFYHSLNSTAVKLGNKLGLNAVLAHGKKLGIESPIRSEAASFLGSSEVSLLDMARVYQVFANQGKNAQVGAIKKIEDINGNIIYQRTKKHEQIIDQSTNELIVEGLKDVIKYGTGYRLRFLSGKVAGKTGTSNDSKDNWFCGFTDDLVIVTWLGSDQQYGFKSNISASTTAAVLWGQVAKKSISYLNSAYLPKPRSLESAYVHPRFGHLDPRGIKMYFPPGRVPEENKSDLYQIEQGKPLRIGMNDL